MKLNFLFENNQSSSSKKDMRHSMSTGCVALRAVGIVVDYSWVSHSSQSSRVEGSSSSAIKLSPPTSQSRRWRRRHRFAAVLSAWRKPSFLPLCCRSLSYKVLNLLYPTSVTRINYYFCHAVKCCWVISQMSKTNCRHIWTRYRHRVFDLFQMIVIIRDLPLTCFVLWNHVKH